jgi:hypothetical protein
VSEIFSRFFLLFLFHNFRCCRSLEILEDLFILANAAEKCDRERTSDRTYGHLIIVIRDCSAIFEEETMPARLLEAKQICLRIFEDDTRNPEQNGMRAKLRKLFPSREVIPLPFPDEVHIGRGDFPLNAVSNEFQTYFDHLMNCIEIGFETRVPVTATTIVPTLEAAITRLNSRESDVFPPSVFQNIAEMAINQAVLLTTNQWDEFLVDHVHLPRNTTNFRTFLNTEREYLLTTVFDPNVEDLPESICAQRRATIRDLMNLRIQILVTENETMVEQIVTDGVVDVREFIKQGFVQPFTTAIVQDYTAVNRAAIEDSVPNWVAQATNRFTTFVRERGLSTDFPQVTSILENSANNRSVRVIVTNALNRVKAQLNSQIVAVLLANQLVERLNHDPMFISQAPERLADVIHRENPHQEPNPQDDNARLVNSIYSPALRTNNCIDLLRGVPLRANVDVLLGEFRQNVVGLEEPGGLGLLRDTPFTQRTRESPLEDLERKRLERNTKLQTVSRLVMTVTTPGHTFLTREGLLAELSLGLLLAIIWNVMCRYTERTEPVIRLVEELGEGLEGQFDENGELTLNCPSLIIPRLINACRGFITLPGSPVSSSSAFRASFVKNVVLNKTFQNEQERTAVAQTLFDEFGILFDERAVWMRDLPELVNRVNFTVEDEY